MAASIVEAAQEIFLESRHVAEISTIQENNHHPRWARLQAAPRDRHHGRAASANPRGPTGRGGKAAKDLARRSRRQARRRRLPRHLDGSPARRSSRTPIFLASKTSSRPRSDSEPSSKVTERRLARSASPPDRASAEVHSCSPHGRPRRAVRQSLPKPSHRRPPSRPTSRP